MAGRDPLDSTLAELGEDVVVAELTKHLPPSPHGVVGPGDDCAAVAPPRGVLLLKSDAVVEGVHYVPSENPLRVGWKAVCRPLSDIAAMGGTPRHATITIFAHPDDRLAYWKSLYRGITKAATKFGLAVVGGETSRTNGPRAVVVALVGDTPRNRIITRSGGEPGDLLLVTGRLGGSLAGKHLDFIPRLEEGRWLAARAGVHAMMDLSDGLAKDAARLALASGCEPVLNIPTLPCTPGASPENALHDGEDYELLVAIDPSSVLRLHTAWKKRFPKLPLSTVGYLLASSTPRPPQGGFDHFSGCIATTDKAP